MMEFVELELFGYEAEMKKKLYEATGVKNCKTCGGITYNEKMEAPYIEGGFYCDC